MKSDTKYNIQQAASELNILGYAFLKNGKRKDALSVFELATKEFPNTANAFDSFAEALMENGQKQEAIKNYEQVLKLNPSDINAKKQLDILKSN